MATHSNILPWKISWTEEPGGLYSPWGCKESDTTEPTHIYKAMMRIIWVFSGLCVQKLKLQNAACNWEYYYKRINIYSF